ncbi:MAG: tandem-95 repeat protein, partial [Crocosphaera sp.]|nr:tandem-95 repeat protein [Crocosphaera sp.]
MKNSTTKQGKCKGKIPKIPEKVPPSVRELLDSKSICDDTDMETHTHASFLDLVPHSNATHIAVNSGSWFDPNTWQDGIIPNRNADVVIAQGVNIFYDQESNLRIHTIRVDGSLSFLQNTNTQLIVDYIAVSDTGTLEMGTELNPIQAQANIIFASVDPNNPEIDTNWDPHQLSRGLVAGDGAKVSIFGEEKTSYVTLADNHLAGATELTFSEPVPTNWAVGDQIVLTGTAWDKNGSHDDNSVTQDEVLTIESINDNTITFRHNDVNGNALRFDHTAPEGFDLDIYVANLTRNVVFQSEGGNDVPPSQRGHTMFMDHDTKIYNAGFYGLGRTNKDVILDDPQFDSEGNLIPGTGTNPKARYSIHFHEILHNNDPNDLDTAQVNGNAIWNTPGWALSVHSSRVDVTNNVSFDAVGAHFATEDGDEQATFRGNIAIKAVGAVTDAPADLLQPKGPRGDQKDFGVRGMGFWLETPYSVVNGFEDNIVTGTKDSGIFVYGHNDVHAQPVVSVSTLPQELQWIAGDATEIKSWAVPLINFRGNKVYNAEGGIELRGVTRDDSGKDFFDISHTEQNVVEDFTIWGVRRHGVDIQYASHITVKDSLIVGNPDNPITRNHIYSNHITTEGTGINSDKNARSIVIENNHVEGFEIAATIAQTASQGYNIEAPFTQSRLIGGIFQNNLYNLYPASGRTDNPSTADQTNPFNNNSSISPYFKIEGNPIFEIPVNDQAPVADFTTTPSGGLAVNFDASQSFDSDYIPEWTDSVNHQYTAGDNTIASFAWDFDNDGVIDDFGRYATHIYDKAGIYSVNLTVTDIQGNTATVTEEVNVTANPFSNIVAGGDFGPNSSDFKQTWVNVSFFRSFSDNTWFHHKDSNRWTKDTNNGWVSADSSGASGLINVIDDRSVTRGLQNISFDATNLGSNNTLKLEVYGINGVFDWSVWGGKPVSSSNTVPFEAVKLLDTGNIANNQFDWTKLEWNNVDFGSGYQTIALRFTTAGVEDSHGEFQAIDNVFIGNLSNSSNDTNTPPTALDDSITINEDQSVIIDVLSNDSDIDGDFIFISNVTQSTHGTITDNGDGTLTYIPHPNFNGNDSFSYTISDLHGGSDSATVDIQINPINDSPTAINDTATTSENQSIIINVLNNDSDIDGDSISVQNLTQPSSGLINQNSDGTLTYTPEANFVG